VPRRCPCGRVLLGHCPHRPGGEGRDRVDPRGRLGRLLPARRRSGTTSCGPGCPTPRSRRSPIPRSPRRKGRPVTARLIVRRLRDQNHKAPGQVELFPASRHHPVFTDSPFTLLQAEEQHRDHAAG
jgi:hypothetical protein